MKVEAAASNSAAVVSAAESTISDEEYARRLYAELNGAVLKTRRSAKLSATQPKQEVPAAAASSGVGSTAPDEQPEVPAPPAAPAAQPTPAFAASLSYVASTTQPALPAVPAAIVKEEDAHLPAPAKKLTGLHRELQRLLGDPAPVRTSSASSTKPKTAGSAAPATLHAAAAAPAPAPTASEAAAVASSQKGQGDAAADATSARQEPAAAVEEAGQQLAPRGGAQAASAQGEAAQSTAAPVPGKARPLRVRLSVEQLQQLQQQRQQQQQLQQQAAAKAAASCGSSPRAGAGGVYLSREGTASSCDALHDALQQRRLQRAAADAAARPRARPAPAPVAVPPPPQQLLEPEPGARSTRSSARATGGELLLRLPASPLARRATGASTGSSPNALAAAAAGCYTDSTGAPAPAPASPPPAAPAAGAAAVVRRAASPEDERAGAVVRPPKASFKRRPLAISPNPTAPAPALAPGPAPAPAPKHAPAPDAPALKAAPTVVSIAVKAEARTVTPQAHPASNPDALDSSAPPAPPPRPLSSRLAVRRHTSDPAAHPPPSRTPSPLPHSPVLQPAAARPAAAPASGKPLGAPPPAAASAASSKPRRIPKMPMVCDGTRWYRAKVVQQRSGRVLLEFMGLEQTPVPFWLDITSERIWTGSYKGKDWRYLGGGAWEPKRGAANSHHSRQGHQRSGGRAAPAGGSGTTDKDSNCSMAAGSDTDLGEDSGRSRREPASSKEAVGQLGARAPAAEHEHEHEQQGPGAVVRRARSARGAAGVQQPHGEGSRALQGGEGGAGEREREREARHEGDVVGKRSLLSVPAPSGSSQEHAATWHEPAADDSHSSEDGAVTAPRRKLPHLPPTALPPAAPAAPTAAPAFTASASCSADAGATPHAASASASASTLQDPLLSCVGSCRPDVPLARPRPGAPAAAAGAEELSATCVESVVTSCAAEGAGAAAGSGADAQQQQQQQQGHQQRQQEQQQQQQQQQAAVVGRMVCWPSPPHDTSLPPRCRRKGKPMRSCIDNEEEMLNALSTASDTATATASSAPTKPQDSHCASSGRPPAPLLSTALLAPTSDDEPTTAPTSHPGAPSPRPPPPVPHHHPRDAPPTSRMLSGTLSSSTAATHQDSSAEPPLPPPRPDPDHPPADPFVSALSQAADSTPDDEEGAALLASLRSCAPPNPQPLCDAPHPHPHKKRRRGNGWTKIMRPSRPSHYYHHAGPAPGAASHWDAPDPPAPLATIPSYHDSSTASHHTPPLYATSPRSNPPHPQPHPPTASSPTKPRAAPSSSDVYSSSPTRPIHPLPPNDPRPPAAPRFGEGSLSAAPAALPPSSLLAPHLPAAHRPAYKRPLDAIFDPALSALLPPATLPHSATITSTAASALLPAPSSSAPHPAAPTAGAHSSPSKRAASTAATDSTVGRVTATAGLPSSLLSCLRRAPPVHGLTAMVGLCRADPLQLLMACPPKPPMPLFKPI